MVSKWLLKEWCSFLQMSNTLILDWVILNLFTVLDDSKQTRKLCTEEKLCPHIGFPFNFNNLLVCNYLSIPLAVCLYGRDCASLVITVSKGNGELLIHEPCTGWWRVLWLWCWWSWGFHFSFQSKFKPFKQNGFCDCPNLEN